MVSYSYDEYGVPTVDITKDTKGIRDINHLMYRGYYYDFESYNSSGFTGGLGLYYLGSRYYDANIGRFISPDDISCLGANGDLNAYNLYAYCSNNPVNRIDITGNSWVTIAIGATISVGSSALVAAIYGKEYTWKDAANDAFLGGLSVANKYFAIGIGVYRGISTAHNKYKAGASIEAALTCGLNTSIINIASFTDLIKIGEAGANVFDFAVLSGVFGTAASLIEEAINRLLELL